MITDRAPDKSLEADAIIDMYLDGRFRRKSKRNRKLTQLVKTLPPKVCGCALCRREEQRRLKIAELVNNEGGGDDGEVLDDGQPGS